MKIQMECLKTEKIPETTKKPKRYKFTFVKDNHKFEIEEKERDAWDIEDIIDVEITLVKNQKPKQKNLDAKYD